MSFLAGAITGNLILDTSGFTGGIAGAIAAATSGAPGIAAPLLAALNLVTEAAKGIAGVIAEAVKSAAAEFDDIGEAAEAAGVSTQFLSSVGRAAADAGSSVEGLGDSLKFVNKNAAEAAGGNEAAVKSFQALGISQADVQANLGDTEGLFFKVVDAISALPTPAAKTAAAMDLMGRGGTSLIPLINKGSEDIKKFAGVFDTLGATVGDQAAKGGDAFKTLHTIVSAALDGIRNAIAVPILDAVAGKADELQDTVIKIAGVIKDLIPPALQVIATVVDLILASAQELLDALTLIGRVSDGLGITDDAGGAAAKLSDGVGQLRSVTNNVSVQLAAGFDPKESSGQIADKLAPVIRDAYAVQVKGTEAAARKAVVAAAVGGRPT